MIYIRLKARTTTEKFSKLVRVYLKKTLRLKQSIPDKVLYELVGRPETEWKRKSKKIEIPKDELAEDEEYLQMQKDRKERQMLRKNVTWESIYIASIPMTLKRKCRRCLDVHDFGHIEKYISEENKDLVNIIKDINKMQEPLKQLVKINRNEGFKEVWKVYTKTFINRKDN